jgi:hypothetical protein
MTPITSKHIDITAAAEYAISITLIEGHYAISQYISPITAFHTIHTSLFNLIDSISTRLY